MMKYLAIAVALLWFGGAQAQSVQQSGPVTPGHVASWATNGVIQDAGTALTPKITTQGLYGTGTNWCDSDINPSSSAALNGYHQLCFSPNLNGLGAYLTYNAYNNATPLPFNISVNGNTFQLGGANWLSSAMDQQFGSTIGSLVCRGATSWGILPPGPSGDVLTSNGTGNCPSWQPGSGGGGGTGVRRITSGTSDNATTADNTIAWSSATSGTKTEILPACTSGNVGQTVQIKDENASWAANAPMNILTSGGTIENLTSLSVPFAGTNIPLQCDGVSNWMLL